VIVRLPVRQRNETARLAFEGDAALAQEVRRRILHYFHLSPKELSSVAGDWLRNWMESRELRDLNPEVINHRRGPYFCSRARPASVGMGS
jgi:hypothetical protein